MNKKQLFLTWYYTRGIRLYSDAWMRFLMFIPFYFSLGLLARTLFAPWHRDVSLKNWRGFNPLRSLQRITWNLFSRIIGATVRIVVILAGVSAFFIVAVGGLVLFVLFLVPPLWVVVALALMFTPWWIFGVSLLLVIIVVVARALVLYKHSAHRPYTEMDIITLAQQPWFHRVWERIGIRADAVPAIALQDIEAFKKLLRTHDITLEECESVITWEMTRQIQRENRAQWFSEERLRRIRPLALWWHYGYTPHLDRFVEDLTKKAPISYSTMPFYGHEDEMAMLELILLRPRENNAILLGAPGIGRKMLVYEFVRRIMTMHYKEPRFLHARVLRIDLGAVVSYAQERGGDAEYELHNLFHEAAYAGNVILVVEHFDEYMQEQHRGFSFATIIEKYADLPSFRMIALTTEQAFHQSIENAQTLLAHFDIIHLKEMNEYETMKTLFMRFYDNDTTVFTYQALREIVRASTQYMQTAPLPKRAIDLAMQMIVAWQNNMMQAPITAQAVLNFVAQKTGMPVGDITSDEQEHLLGLEDAFHQRIIGQSEAVRAVANAVRRMRSGMARGNRPAGSFLFLGPTGVGKTEMAKTLAAEYFGTADKMIRLDMSEYNGPQALARLIGSRAQNKKGHLSSLVREHPYALLLLDELEKATEEVLDVFLQILDEGFVHDAFGVKITFTSMIIIATSNAGSQLIQEHLTAGHTYDVMKKDILEHITQQGIFRPEFINRFDDVIVFHPLKGDEVLRITQLLLKKFAEHMEEEKNIKIIFDPDVPTFIMENGYDPLYGARSLLRYIDETVADALARKFISGNIHRGEDVVFTVADLEI